MLWIVAVQLTLLPWALGGMRLWAQLPSLGLALLGLTCALLPREYRAEHGAESAFRLIMWPKLIRFPLFWLGLGLLGYIVLQGSNPAWQYETDGTGWWLRAISHVGWLPTGVRVPLENWGPWRMLMVYAASWLTVCTIWIGFTRRRSLRFLLAAIAINSVLLAAFGVAERLLAHGRMFWFWQSPNPAFFATFVYKNHAGAYLNLTLAVAGGLAAWYHLRGSRRLDKSSPAGLFAFFALGIAVAVLVSLARGATIVMLAYLLVSIVGFTLHQRGVPRANRKPVVVLALVVLFGAFVFTGLQSLYSKTALVRLQQGLAAPEVSLASRRLATRAALDMLGDYWVTGAGAGSFKFIFPTYQKNYPDLVGADGNRFFWEHAHNDLVEIPAELGAPGVVIILGAIGYLVVLLGKNSFWRNPLSTGLGLGIAGLLVYSGWDFPLQCPAILMLACSLGVIAAMWARLETRRSSA